MALSFEYLADASFNSLQLSRGVAASYKVSASTTIQNLTIVPGETLRDTIGEDGVIISKRVQDFLIKVSDLEGNEPKTSHTITIGSEIFELINLDNEKAFKFHNPPVNSVYRVHTILTTGDPG